MTKLTPKEIVSIVLAFILLLCLFPLPYGFFVFIRLITTIVFGYFAYDFYHRGETAKCIVAALIMLLVQYVFTKRLTHELKVKTSDFSVKCIKDFLVNGIFSFCSISAIIISPKNNKFYYFHYIIDL